MVSLQVENLGLKYPLPRTFSLARKPAAATGSVGGKLSVGNDGKKYITALEDVTFSLASRRQAGADWT